MNVVFMSCRGIENRIRGQVSKRFLAELSEPATPILEEVPCWLNVPAAIGDLTRTAISKLRNVVGCVTPCAPFSKRVADCGAHGVTHPADLERMFPSF